MRHGDVRIDDVVPAGRSVRVAVKASHVGVQPVGTRAGVRRAGTRDHREIGRRSPEPLLALLGRHCRLHEVAYLHAGENQVVPDLLLGKAEILQTVVAHIVRAVATKAVVQERVRAALQGNHVLAVDRGAVQFHLFGRMQGAGQDQQRDEHLSDDRHFFSLFTRSPCRELAVSCPYVSTTA